MLEEQEKVLEEQEKDREHHRVFREKLLKAFLELSETTTKDVDANLAKENLGKMFLILKLALNGDKILAIKHLREMSYLGLAEAKAEVETFMFMIEASEFVKEIKNKSS